MWLQMVIFFSLHFVCLFVFNMDILLYVTLIIFKNLNVLLAGNMMHIYSYASNIYKVYPVCRGSGGPQGDLWYLSYCWCMSLFLLFLLSTHIPKSRYLRKQTFCKCYKYGTWVWCPWYPQILQNIHYSSVFLDYKLLGSLPCPATSRPPPKIEH